MKENIQAGISVRKICSKVEVEWKSLRQPWTAGPIDASLVQGMMVADTPHWRK